jgi:hypothetical protein
MTRVPLVAAALLAGSALSCGSPAVDTAQTGPAPPLSLATPTGPDGTAPGSIPDAGGAGAPGGGGLAARLTPSATPEYLRQVAARTRQIATGRVRMVAAAVGGRGREGRTTELTTLEAAYDNGSARSRIHLDPTGAVKEGVTGIAALFGGPVDIVQIGPVSYFKVQGGGPLGTAGGKWMMTEGGGSALRPIFDMFKIEDVSGFLGALACAAPVQDAGHEPIDGVATNHYRVDAEAAKLKACIAQDANAGNLLDNLGDAERARVDVWVDEGALVRRLVVTADEKALGAGLARKFPGATSVMTMSLSGFGERVVIEPPPADQVTSGIGGLEGLLGGSLGDGSGTGTGDPDLDDLLSGLG